MKKKKIRREIYNNDYIGVVEDVNDPLRLGRVKVRVEAIDGRKDDKESIPTSALPWLEPSGRGSSFSTSSVGKVVYVAFEDGDYYKGCYFAEEHYDINLQNKLESLSDSSYVMFTAYNFDHRHQYYCEEKVGLMFDYMKSNMNFRPNGDIRMNLKDNNAKLMLGSENASQQSILGNHFIDMFSDLVNVLMTTPYFGNLGAPVLPSPQMLEFCNKYLATKSTLLSNNVYVVDNNMVKAQDRKYDTVQYNDNFNDENLKQVSNSVSKLPEPEPAPIVGANPTTVDTPPNNFSDNLSTSNVNDERMVNPVGADYVNGKVDVSNLTVSKYASEAFSDERKYLLDSVAKALDKLLDDYKLVKNTNWNDVVVTKGYTNYERQTNTRKQYPLKAPLAGQDPFGFANQVELYFGVKRNDDTTVNAIKDYLRDGKIDKNINQVLVLDYLVTNGKKVGLKLVKNTNVGDVQWWHWIYDETIIPKPEPVAVVAPVEEVKKSEKLTSEQILVENYIRDSNISFFTETLDVDEIDVKYKNDTNHLVEFATDKQLQKRKDYLLERISTIHAIPDWFNKPSFNPAFESFRQEEERFSLEYQKIKSELEDRVFSKIDGSSSFPKK